VNSLVKGIRHRLMWRKHASRLDALAREHPLKYLFLEVTRRCNLACAYCGSGCTGVESRGELTSAEWVDVIRQVASDFEPHKIMVAVTGGEPLIKEGILDVFRELHARGFPFGMVTNGQRLGAEPGLAAEVVATGIGSISVSLDAPPDVNDRLRGRGTSEKANLAFCHLREAGFKGKLEVISTLTSPALASIDEMRRHVASMRVPLWRVAPVMPIGRAAERPDLVPDARGVRSLLEYVYRSRKDGLIPCPEFSEEGFLGARFEGHVRPYLAQCRAGVTVAGIKSDGTIGACPELSAAFDQGDIRKDRFRAVWDERYEILRDRSWARRGQCADCRHFRVCRGGAMHLYAKPGEPFLRCLYLQCKEAETPIPSASRTE
jgi:radical SAM protein with 4Fe4S-binding SPASM domain